MDKYIIGYLIIGYFVAPALNEWINNKADEISYKFELTDKEVIAAYLLWPIMVVIITAIFYWPKKWRKNDTTQGEK